MAEPAVSWTRPDPAAADAHLACGYGIVTPGAPFLPIRHDYPGLARVTAADHPAVYVVHGFLSQEECDALIGAAGSIGLARSVTDEGRSDARTSATATLDHASPPCAPLLARVDALFYGTAARRTERVQVARYADGEEYRAHLDAAAPSRYSAVVAAGGGNRVATVLVYLNDVLRGGETHFPLLGLRVAPRGGCALVFFPGTLDGRADVDTLHAALPASAGHTKWVAQVWVHEGEVVADGCWTEAT